MKIFYMLYNFLFRRIAENPKENDFYVNTYGKLVKVIEVGCLPLGPWYAVCSDNHTYFFGSWGYFEEAGITKTSPYSLHELNYWDKKKYWTRIIRDEI